MKGKAAVDHPDSETKLQALWRKQVWPVLALCFTPLGSAICAALGYGTWTFAVNVSTGGYFIAIRSGLVHAAMSFCITYSSVLLMRAVFKRVGPPLLGAVCAAVTTLSLTYLLLISVHLYIGTPHIAWTLAPGLIPTIGYDTVYSMFLYRSALNRARTSMPIPHPTPVASLTGDCREKF